MNKEVKRNLILAFLTIFALFFLYKVRDILLPFVLGGLIAYLLNGATNFLEQKFNNRKIISICLVFCFSVIVILFFAFIIPILLEQITSLIRELSTYIVKNSNLLGEKFNKITSYFELDTNIDINSYIASYGKKITEYSLSLLNKIVIKSLAFISIISLLIITPITAYHFLVEWNNILSTIMLYIPKNKQIKAKYLFTEIGNVLSGCLKGQLNVCVILGLFYGTLLFFSGLKYGFVIGLLTGLASFIPYFGMFFGFAIGLIMTFSQFGFSIPHIFLTSVIFMLGQFLEGNFITPKLVGNKIKLHPLWIIFALFCGGSLFGFYGLILALPMAGIIGVLVRFYIMDFEK